MELDKQIEELKKQRDELANRLLAQNPDWRDLNAQVRTIERLLPQIQEQKEDKKAEAKK